MKQSSSGALLFESVANAVLLFSLRRSRSRETTMHTHTVLRAAPVLLIALALGSCGPRVDQFAPACPVPGLLKPLAELARYRGASRDFRDLIVRARVTDITGKCQPGDDKNTLATTVQVVVDATRGPAMDGDAIGLPVFVAVTDSGAVRDKVEFSMPVAFPHNVDTSRAVSKEVRMEIPISAQKSGAAYGVIAGFQLTPDEVAEWRRNHPR
jgi:hypothetical protein